MSALLRRFGRGFVALAGPSLQAVRSGTGFAAASREPEESWAQVQAALDREEADAEPELKLDAAKVVKPWVKTIKDGFGGPVGGQQVDSSCPVLKQLLARPISLGCYGSCCIELRPSSCLYEPRDAKPALTGPLLLRADCMARQDQYEPPVPTCLPCASFGWLIANGAGHDAGQLSLDVLGPSGTLSAAETRQVLWHRAEVWGMRQGYSSPRWMEHQSQKGRRCDWDSAPDVQSPGLSGLHWL